MDEQELNAQPLSDDGEFSAVQFFANGVHEYALRNVSAKRAVQYAVHLATSVAAKIGTTLRVIVTDGGDDCVWQWDYGKGMVWPKTPNVPVQLQAHPHEFDCAECGRHVIDYVPPPDPKLCAACVGVPGWYDHEDFARMIDPNNTRKVQRDGKT